MKAAVTSSKNYTGLEAVKAFDIDIALWAGLAGFAALGAAAAALFGRKKKMR